MDNAFDSLSLGPTDSYNTLVWDKEEMATGFQCEASGQGMEHGGDLKYMLTQEQSGETRSWLISEEQITDREFGLAIQTGTELTIDFLQSPTVAVAFGNDDCSDTDGKQQVFIEQYEGWNGTLPTGRAARKAAPGSFLIVSNQDGVDFLMDRASSFSRAEIVTAPAPGDCISNSGKVYVKFG